MSAHSVSMKIKRLAEQKMGISGRFTCNRQTNRPTYSRQAGKFDCTSEISGLERTINSLIDLLKVIQKKDFTVVSLGLVPVSFSNINELN